MYSIVPLAGPDFISDDGKIKALSSFDDGFLLEKVLKSRPWHTQIKKYIFILIDGNETRSFASQYLKEWFPNSDITFLESNTKGAALTILAGLTQVHEFNSVIAVDLGDILYETSMEPLSIFAKDQFIGAIVPTFKSSSSIYSYVKFKTERSLMAREKKVISENASAGTYIFKNLETILYAAFHSASNFHDLNHNGLLYVCPMLNALADLRLLVHVENVQSVVDIKLSKFRYF